MTKSKRGAERAVKRPYEKNPMGHVWKKNEYDGKVDIFGYDGGHHNGPVCMKCGYAFCHHCRDLPERACARLAAARGRK